MMKDIEIEDIFFILLLIGGLIGLIYIVYLTSVYSAPKYGSNSMLDMMRHMMSGGLGIFYMPIWLQVLSFLFIGIFIFGILGILFGNILLNRDKGMEYHKLNDYMDNIMKILKPDERRVIELLLENDGKMLQRDIRWEAGFTRLKTHRIINRLIERKIIKKIPRGSTNLIILEDWLINKKEK